MITRKVCVPFLALICAGLAAAQTGLIQTYAGNGTQGFSGDGGPATSAEIANPLGLALDANGDLYIAVPTNERVRVVNAASGIITTVAGGGTGGVGGLATAAQLQGPCGVVLDSAGDIFLSDTCMEASGGGGGGGGGGGYGSPSNMIWRVDALTGIITSVAGGGSSGLGDGGPATSALLNVPVGLAIDASGDIFLADSGNNRIRRVDAVTGIITTVAGNGTAGFAGDGGLATAASLNTPDGVAIDSAGDLYIADSGNNRIRFINAATGIISTMAGTGVAGFNGDGILATTASLNNPLTVLLNSSGNLLIADSLNYRVRLLDMSSGLIWTLAGNGSSTACCGIGNGVQATEAVLDAPAGLAQSTSGSVFISELQGNRVREVSLPSPFASTAVTISANAASVPSGNPVTLTATLSAINGLAANATGEVEFINGTTPLTAVPVANGSAAFTTTTLSQGVHTINAIYSGNSAFGYAVAPPFSITITAPQASVALAASPNPATANQPITLTATLTPSTATGTVTFLNGTTVLGTATTTTSNVVTLSGITLAAGNYSLTAQYGGSSGFSPATSPVVSLTVQATSSVVVTSSADPSNTKQSVTFTATVTPATATGTVQFLDGATRLGSATLSNGVATFTPASLNEGTHSITASYAGDANDTSATSAVLTQTVQASSSVVVISSANPAVTGATVTFTATVTPSAATGNVQFLDGTTVLGTVAVTSGVASFTTSTLSQGSHSIAAAYAGDVNDTSATSAVLAQTIQASSSVVVISSANPAVVGATVTFTATVTPSTATGNVKFLDGTTLLGTVALTSGVASFTTSTLSQGSHSITAAYAGDANDTSATSAVLTQTVQASSSVVVISSANPAVVGASVTFTATVTPATATGNVKFLDGTTLLGTVALTSGVASFTTSTLSQGSHSITASYAGDANDTSSTSAVLTQTIQAASSVALASSPNPAAVGATVTLTATVTPATATGNVKFLDGTTLLGTVALTSGVASFTTSTLSQGSHSITAAYAGDANNTSATSAVLTQTIQASAAITLTSTPNPAAVGSTVTFSATVTPATATGTVQFLNGATVLGTATLANGTAFLTTSALSQGTNSITAIYSGDADDTSATSAVLAQSVKQSVGMTIGYQTPIVAGQTETITATLTSSTATGTVTFTAGGTTLATVSVTSGIAVYSTTSLAQGTNAISISYSGDTNFLSASTGVTVTVLGSTSITVVSNLNPALSGQTVTFTATVTPAAATGTVQFYTGSTLLGTATLSNGIATYSTSALAAGTQSITADYTGSSTYGPSYSSALSEVVKTNTSVALSSSLNPSTAGSAITFTAVVSPSAATGTVQFLDGATVLGSAPLANGSASFSISSLAAGTHSISADYSGSTTYNAANSSVLSEVVKANTSVALSSSLNPATVGSAITFIAVVSPSTATGTVQFLDGSSVLGSATIASGQASFSTSSLSQGAQSITASYGGDAGDNASTSAALIETVNPAPPSAPSNLSASATSSSQINLTWTASATSGVTYNIYESTASGFALSASTRIASGVTATAYSVTGLNASTTYYYRVTAVNAGGESAATSQASATTIAALACHVTYSVTSQKSSTFDGAISIENTGTTKITSWTLTWTWPGNQKITETTDANYKQSGANVTLTNESNNGQINAGATLSGIKFDASYSESNTAPSSFYVNGTLCH